MGPLTDKVGTPRWYPVTPGVGKRHGEDAAAGNPHIGRVRGRVRGDEVTARRVRGPGPKAYGPRAPPPAPPRSYSY